MKDTLKYCANPDCQKPFVPNNGNQIYCCKKCNAHTYHLRHREELIAYQKNYRKVNREEILAKKLIYYKTHLEEHKKKNKEYFQNHRAECYARGRASYQKHREEILLKRKLRRAKKTA